MAVDLIDKWPGFFIAIWHPRTRSGAPDRQRQTRVLGCARRARKFVAEASF